MSSNVKKLSKSCLSSVGRSIPFEGAAVLLSLVFGLALVDTLSVLDFYVDSQSEFPMIGIEMLHCFYYIFNNITQYRN